jgi:hypothetical protein
MKSYTEEDAVKDHSSSQVTTLLNVDTLLRLGYADSTYNAK